MEFIQANFELLPCPFNLGWELVKVIEIKNRNNEDKFIGGFSAISYVEENDSVYLQKKAYAGQIEIYAISELLFSNDKIVNSSQISTLKLKNKLGKKFFRKMDSEGLAINGSSAFILNETRIWNWKRPFDIYKPPSVTKFDLQTGKKIKSINLPNSWKYGTSGIESLSFFGEGMILVSTEGRNSHNYYRNRFIKFFNRLRFKSSDYQERNSDSYKSARYLTINQNNTKGKTSIFKIDGKVRDLLVIDDSKSIIVLSTSSDSVFLNGFDLIETNDQILIKDQRFRWKVPFKAKWEGIAIGPTYKKGLPTILLVNDNDNGSNSLISVFIPNKGKNCNFKKFEKNNYSL